MDRTTASVTKLTEDCIFKFEQLLIPDNSRRIEILESRLADFNLWVDGVGALARPGASLDSRLQNRAKDLVLVKNVLIMLADSLDYYDSLAGDDTTSDASIQNIDSAIKNLALIGVAIRRTGKASRNRRADRTFNPDGYGDLRKHLECIVLLRPSEEALFRETEQGLFIAKMDSGELSTIQKRLIEANLRRRHNFLRAQKHAITQKEGPIPLPTPIDSTAINDSTPEDAIVTENPDYVAPKQNLRTKTGAAPTISGFSLASTAEGTLQYAPADRKYTPRTAKTQITFIASDAEFPKAPSISSSREISRCPCCCQSLPVETFVDPKLWKKHIIEDLCPYTCIAENCPSPQLLFCTRNEWETHVKKSHLPQWQCPFCEEKDATYPTMESMGDHLHTDHKDELLHNSLGTLLSWSAVQTMGITSCPLCSSHGPEDSPELVDHVLRHAYDFALRALPWTQYIVHDLNTAPGSFKPPGNSEDEEIMRKWIDTANHESASQPALELCSYDTADHSAPESTHTSEYTDFFSANAYFDDRLQDQSSVPQYDQSVASRQSAEFVRADFKSASFRCVAFSPDGQYFGITSSENLICIWHTVTGILEQTLVGHSTVFTIHAIAFSPNGCHLASASSDTTIIVWDTVTGAMKQKLEGHSRSVYSVAYSADGQQLASGSRDGNIILWDLVAGVPRLTLKAHSETVYVLVFSPDGKELASSSWGSVVRQWDVVSGVRKSYFITTSMDIMYSVAFWPGRSQLVTGTSRGTVRLLERTMNTPPVELYGHSDSVDSIAFSPDGSFLASASGDCSIKLWTVDLGTVSCFQTIGGHDDEVDLVAFLPDNGQLVSASRDGTVRLWDRTGACIRTLVLT